MKKKITKKRCAFLGKPQGIMIVIGKAKKVPKRVFFARHIVEFGKRFFFHLVEKGVLYLTFFSVALRKKPKKNQKKSEICIDTSMRREKIRKKILLPFLPFLFLGVIYFSAFVTAEVHVDRSMVPDFSAFVDEGQAMKKEGKSSEGWMTFILQKISMSIAFLVFPLTVLSVVISGIRYIVSHGDQNQTGNAKKALINSTVGFFLALFSYTIVYQVLVIVDEAAKPTLQKTCQQPMQKTCQPLIKKCVKM